MEVPLAAGAGTEVNPTRLSVLVIGAGRIGGGFDHPGHPKVLTHAHAWHRLGADLAFQDPDPNRLEDIAARWGAKAFPGLDQALDARAWDVVVVASPDHTHLEVVRTVAPHPWKVLVLEKPPARDRREWNELRELLLPRREDVVVDFTRRWCPGLVALRRDIHSGRFGELLHGYAVYGNGLVHNAAHLTDLLDWFFGPLSLEGLSGTVADRPGDPSCAFRLRTADQAPIAVEVVDSRRFTAMELDLVFAAGRVRLADSMGALHLQSVVPSPEHEGYRILSEPERHDLGLGLALAGLAEAVVARVDRGAPPGGTLDEVAAGWELCLQLQERRDASPAA